MAAMHHCSVISLLLLLSSLGLDKTLVCDLILQCLQLCCLLLLLLLESNILFAEVLLALLRGLEWLGLAAYR